MYSIPVWSKQILLIRHEYSNQFSASSYYQLRVLNTINLAGHSLGAGLAILVSAALSTYPAIPVLGFGCDLHPFAQIAILINYYWNLTNSLALLKFHNVAFKSIHYTPWVLTSCSFAICSAPGTKIPLEERDLQLNAEKENRVFILANELSDEPILQMLMICLVFFFVRWTWYWIGLHLWNQVGWNHEDFLGYSSGHTVSVSRERAIGLREVFCLAPIARRRGFLASEHASKGCWCGHLQAMLPPNALFECTNTHSWQRNATCLSASCLDHCFLALLSKLVWLQCMSNHPEHDFLEISRIQATWSGDLGRSRKLDLCLGESD